MEHQNAENSLPFTPQQLRSLIAAPEGRKLLSLLSRDGGAAFREAAAAFRAGDWAGAECAAAPLFRTPEAQELLAGLLGKQAQDG